MSHVYVNVKYALPESYGGKLFIYHYSFPILNKQLLLVFVLLSLVLLGEI